MADRIAICDKEKAFVQILAGYLQKKYKHIPEIEAYDNMDTLLSSEKKMDLCLIGEGMADSFQLQKLLNQSAYVIYLSGKKKIDSVFKYQSVERVVGDLLKLCAEKEIPFFRDRKLFFRREDVEIKAFYAPARHLLQSTIALTMGQMLAKEKKVLYLNLEPYSGFEYLLNKTYEHDLMDILFFLKEEKEKFPLRMEGILERVGDLYYIPPVFCYPDMEEVDSVLWHKLLQRIVDEMDYDIVLLDLTEHTRGLLSLLELCNEIFMCLPGDRLSQAKEEEYEKMLCHMKKEYLLERTKKSIVPVFHDIPAAAVMFTHGQLVRYIKEIRAMNPVKQSKEET